MHPIYIDILLSAVAFIAGTVDAIAGGGGLITVPAILMTGMNPVMALGTIKLQGAVCEFSASLHFLLKKQVDYRLLKKAALFTMIGSILGTIVLHLMPIAPLRHMIPWLLLSVLVYYNWKRNYKAQAEQKEELQPRTKAFFWMGSIIGFYNGFFGPGTGSIWAVALMKVFKLNIQKATMYAKPLNLIGNLTALSIFITSRHIDFQIGIAMSVGSFLGGKYGAMLVMYKDEAWLKGIFLLLMITSTAVTFYIY